MGAEKGDFIGICPFSFIGAAVNVEDVTHGVVLRRAINAGNNLDPTTFQQVGHRLAARQQEIMVRAE